MTHKKINVADLPDFDMAKYLPDDEAIAEYLTIVLEENDPAALYKALRPNAQPRFDTIARVCNALGVRLVAQVVPTPNT